MTWFCVLFGCAYDPVDDSSSFECFRCRCHPSDFGWSKGFFITRWIYRRLMGWR